MQKKRAELFLAERCEAAVIRKEERLWSRSCAKTVSGPAACEKRSVQNVMEKTYRHGWKGRVCSCAVRTACMLRGLFFRQALTGLDA